MYENLIISGAEEVALRGNQLQGTIEYEIYIARNGREAVSSINGSTTIDEWSTTRLVSFIHIFQSKILRILCSDFVNNSHPHFHFLTTLFSVNRLGFTNEQPINWENIILPEKTDLYQELAKRITNYK